MQRCDQDFEQSFALYKMVNRGLIAGVVIGSVTAGMSLQKNQILSYFLVHQCDRSSYFCLLLDMLIYENFIGFVIGILIGHFAISKTEADDSSGGEKGETSARTADSNREILFSSADPARMKANLRLAPRFICVIHLCIWYM